MTTKESAKVRITIGRERLPNQDLQRYILYTEGSTDGHIALDESQLVFPNKSFLIRKKFPVKIRGIVVGARAEDERGHAIMEGGGVGQNFVDLRVHAGNYSTEVMINIYTFGSVRVGSELTV